jgi:hypothetical protein
MKEAQCPRKKEQHELGEWETVVGGRSSLGKGSPVKELRAGN